jgi:endonuclease-3
MGSRPRKSKGETGLRTDLAVRRRAGRIVRKLAAEYGMAECALVHRNPYELLVATILSAQCTDARVNLVTPALFARFPDARALALGRPEEIEELVRTTGFFRNKAKNLLGMARAVVDRHGGVIPEDLEALVKLPGVGRKTAQVVLGVAFGKATGIVVDTHVGRLSRRLGLTTHQDPVKVERDLMAVVPRPEWIQIAHRLIHHGRRVCLARKPRCESCSLQTDCPRAGVASARPAEQRSGTTAIPVPPRLARKRSGTT